MRFLGFVFVGLITGGVLVGVDYTLPGTFLDGFLSSGYLETFAALAGFNLAAVIFLLGQVMAIEEKTGKSFEGSKREIKHNSYFLLGSFALSFVLLVLRPDPVAGVFISAGDALNNQIYYGFNVLIVGLFALGLYAIYEILQAVFKLSRSN